MPNNYYPILKTTIAEMRALKKLDFVTWRNITPILELTKSRKSKNNQESCVYRKIDEIKEIVGDNE
ncbi:beta family protein, partial [Escherichia coli]